MRGQILLGLLVALLLTATARVPDRSGPRPPAAQAQEVPPGGQDLPAVVHETIAGACEFFKTHEGVVDTYLVGKDAFEFIEGFTEAMTAAEVAEAAGAVILDPRDLVSYLITRAVVKVAIENIDPPDPVHYRHLDEQQRGPNEVTVTVRVFVEFDWLDDLVECLQALKIEIPHSGAVAGVDVGFDDTQVAKHFGMTTENGVGPPLTGLAGTFRATTDKEGRARFTLQVKDETQPNGRGVKMRESNDFTVSADPYPLKNLLGQIAKLLPEGEPSAKGALTAEWHQTARVKLNYHARVWEPGGSGIYLWADYVASGELDLALDEEGSFAVNGSIATRMTIEPMPACTWGPPSAEMHAFLIGGYRNSDSKLVFSYVDLPMDLEVSFNCEFPTPPDLLPARLTCSWNTRRSPTTICSYQYSDGSVEQDVGDFPQPGEPRPVIEADTAIPFADGAILPLLAPAGSAEIGVEWEGSITLILPKPFIQYP